jgi:hypothetical protein
VRPAIDWLSQTLEACRDEPVVIAMHHPPFPTLIGHMDAIGLLEGADAMRAIVARHPNVERVICGHLHRAIEVRFGGTIASTCPAPAHQVCLEPRARCGVRLLDGTPGVPTACPRSGVGRGHAPGQRRPLRRGLPVP